MYKSSRQIKLIYHRDMILLGFKIDKALYFKPKSKTLTPIRAHFTREYGFVESDTTATQLYLTLPIANDQVCRIHAYATCNGVFVEMEVIDAEI